MRVLLIVILLLQIASCRWIESAGPPALEWANLPTPDGTPLFKKGFRDGCSTAFYSRGNVYYRTKYGYRVDPILFRNGEYRFGHQRGYGYCFTLIAGGAGPNSSWDRYVSPYGYDKTFNAKDIGEAWDGFFGGGVGPFIQDNPGNGLDATVNVYSGGAGGGVFSANPLWAGGSKGQFFGQ